MVGVTRNYGFIRPVFDASIWHDDVNGNFDQIDSLLFSIIGFGNFVGGWTNSTNYTVGQRVFDPDNGTIWNCLVAHASEATGTFSASRLANPSYWNSVSTLPFVRGAWTPDTVYASGDVAYDNSESLFGIASVTHTSSSLPATMRTDIANWSIIADLSALSVAVGSVNGQTGTVILETDDISDAGQANKWVTATEKANIATNAIDISNIQGAQIITAAATAGLAAERVLTNTASITWDFATAAQAKANLAIPVPVASGGTGQVTAAEAIGELTQALATDTTPDRLLDFAAVYDASLDTGSKVALYNVSGMAVLATGTVAAAATLDIPLDVAGYSAFKAFKLHLRNIVPVSDNVTPWLRISDDSGATFEADASDYAWNHVHNELASANNSFEIGDGADSEIELSIGLGNAAGEFGEFEVTIVNPAQTALRKHVYWTGFIVVNTGAIFRVNGSGLVLATAAVTDIRFMLSTGNITSMTWTLIGLT